jgi:hypothetical protein
MKIDREEAFRLLNNPEELKQMVLDLSPDFNGEEYADIHPELNEKNITDESVVHLHYLTKGREQGYPAYDIYRKQLDKLPENFDVEAYGFLHRHLLSHIEDLGQWYTEQGHSTEPNFDISLDDILSEIVNQNVYFPDDSIFIMNHSSTKTGAPIFAQDLANYLVEQGHDNIVFVDVYPNNIFKLHPKIKKVYHFDKEYILLDILEQNKPKVIYSNSLTKIITETHLYAKYIDKTIFHYHECWFDCLRGGYDSKKAKFKWISKNCKANITVAEKINDNYPYDPEARSKSYVVPPFINNERIKQLLTTKKRNTKNKRVTLGMCGTLNARKNPHLFTEAAKLLPEYDFIWVGSTSDIELPNLEFVPQCDNPNEYLEKCDYFFLTSIRDPCPIVVLESLLLNRKVIVCDGNIRYQHPEDQLENYLTIQDHHNDVSKIIEGLKSLNLNTELQKTTKNHDYIIKNFTHPHIINKCEDFMEFFE